MRRPLTVAVALGALLAGCGDGGESAPAACLGGSGPYLDALLQAPSAVRLAGGAEISSCLVEGQEAGELARVGSALVRAATRLNARARAAPGGPAPLQLGYLVGSVQRGAEETSGIHADLVRRLEAAATFSPAGNPPPALEAGYRRGLEAGRTGG